MVKSATIIAVAASALLATPVLAAKHQPSCYDHAWESQDMKDCLANPDSANRKPTQKMAHKRMHHGMAHMKDMKGTDDKGMDDKDMPMHK
jgi:hypothetical protein